MSGQKKKKNFQIEAFKHKVVVDPKYADNTWKILEHTIHEIYNHNASGLSFEELYSAKATDEYESARQKVGKFINAESREIVFTRNATEAINLVAYSWGLSNLKKGDEVMVTWNFLGCTLQLKKDPAGC